MLLLLLPLLLSNLLILYHFSFLAFLVILRGSGFVAVALAVGVVVAVASGSGSCSSSDS